MGKPQGLLQLLEGLEGALKERIPGVTFFFGEEDVARPVSGPVITWQPISGAAQEETRERAEEDRQTVVDEEVEVTARCVGSRRVSPTELTPRKADFAASEAIYVVLGDVLAARHQGYYKEDGWRSVQPRQPNDAGWPIEYTFRVRVQRTTLPRDLTTPTSAPGTVAVES